MSAFWAIVLDTWRQSRQQVVYIIMLIVLALTCVLTIGITSAYLDDEGTRHVTVAGNKDAGLFLEDIWVAAYASTLFEPDETAEPVNPFEPPTEDQLAAQEEQMEAARKAADEEAKVPVDRRATELILSGAARVLFFTSMLLFIAAASGYFPAMLEAGGIDILLAKPVDRLRVFLGKYAGGLALYTVAISGAYLVLFIGVGIRTGVFVPRLFLAIPLQIFAAAVLYAMLVALGIVSRSSTLCIIVGYVFYIVIDWVLSGVIQASQVVDFGNDWIDTTADVIRYTVPNFRYMQGNAVNSVLNIPVMQVQPFVTAGAWMLILLAFGYWRFSRTDY